MSKFKDLKKLIPGKKYTLVEFDEKGLPCSIHITFQAIKFTPYESFDDAATILFKEKISGKLFIKRLFGNKQIVAFRGWIKPPSNILVSGKVFVDENLPDVPVACVEA